MQSPSPQQLIRLPEVIRRTGLSRSYLYKAIAEARFPKYRKCGRASVWSAAEVDAWITARLADVDGMASPEAAE